MPDRETILITDIPSRIVSGVAEPCGQPGRWRSHPYRCREYSGRLVGCGMNTNPDPLVIRLDADGPYRVHLCLFKMFEGFETALRVRLHDDPSCRKITVPEHVQSSDVHIYEVRWRDADLTGRDLVVDSEFGTTASLAAIRLEPLDCLPAESPPKIAFPMAVTEDGHQAFRNRPHRRPEDLLEALDTIPADSCMRILIWGLVGADLCNFPTAIGTYDYGGSQDALSDSYRLRDENMRRWREQGWDSMQIVKTYARRRGWEFHVSMRAQAFAAAYPFDDLFRSEFFANHPEWRCRDEKGESVSRMSYAYPQVQEHLLALTKEMLAYEPDGFSILFVRGLPLVLYEQTMIEGFQKTQGLDPLALEENDERWLNYKASVITQYMRRVADLVGKKRRFSVMVPGNRQQCAWGGLDVAAWVKEGLVQDVYPMGLRYDSQDVHRCAAEALDLDYFLSLSGREHIRVIPVLSETWEPSFGKLFSSHLQKGADGYGLWDGAYARRHHFGDLGYPDRPPCRDTKPEYRKIPIERLGELRIDRYHPWEAF